MFVRLVLHRIIAKIENAELLRIWMTLSGQRRHHGSSWRHRRRIPAEQVPHQKTIIRKCNLACQAGYHRNQMLDSMIVRARPCK
ncbi:MAG: hypothetical protein ACLTI1_10320 [Clostridia bacterium]